MKMSIKFVNANTAQREEKKLGGKIILRTPMKLLLCVLLWEMELLQTETKPKPLPLIFIRLL